MEIFGVCNKELIHTDVSTSEKGAKNYATRHGYKIVSVRGVNSGNVIVISEKVNNKWIQV